MQSSAVLAIATKVLAILTLVVGFIAYVTPYWVQVGKIQIV